MPVPRSRHCSVSHGHAEEHHPSNILGALPGSIGEVKYDQRTQRFALAPIV
ncbi:MAG TPA: hypothetical protein VHM70_07330 [Polyangiaceae bacterium]|jgi:hypothetical protein|nr:hypothetical protein [Polyangiaceae bacterium]